MINEQEFKMANRKALLMRILPRHGHLFLSNETSAVPIKTLTARTFQTIQGKEIA